MSQFLATTSIRSFSFSLTLTVIVVLTGLFVLQRNAFFKFVFLIPGL